MTDWRQTKGDCVLATRIAKNGYGRLPSGRRGVYLYAHRYAWEQAHGPIPEGMHVHHRCGVKACMNVEHLELLTPRQHYALNRRCDHPGRVLRPDGRTRCRICERAWRREYENERYATDPVYRAKKIARAAATKRARREKGGVT